MSEAPPTQQFNVALRRWIFAGLGILVAVVLGSSIGHWLMFICGWAASAPLNRAKGKRGERKKYSFWGRMLGVGMR